jgi:hypothetical protein
MHFYFQQPLIEAEAGSRLNLVLIPYNRDAMPIHSRDPFIFCVFPGALRGDGEPKENGADQRTCICFPVVG